MFCAFRAKFEAECVHRVAASMPKIDFPVLSSNMYRKT